MSKNTYAFGLESPVRFVISDKLATNYNDAMEKYLRVQQRLNQKWGKAWNPTKNPLDLKWTPKQQKAWDTMAAIFDKVYKEASKQGIKIYPNDFMDDYLVKDKALQQAQKIMSNRSRAITLAAGLSTLYVLLRGLKRHV